MRCHWEDRTSWSFYSHYTIPPILWKLNIFTVAICWKYLLIFTHIWTFFLILYFLYHLIYFFKHLGCIYTVNTIHSTNVPSSSTFFIADLLLPWPSYKFIFCHFYIDIMIFLLNYWTFPSPHLYISAKLSVSFGQIDYFTFIVFPLSLINFTRVIRIVADAVWIFISYIPIRICIILTAHRSHWLILLFFQICIIFCNHFLSQPW